MRHLCLAAAFVLVSATAAFANPCGFSESGRVVIKGYPVGSTTIPKDQVERLEKFAETASRRFGICILAQVDKQGTKAANEKVAKGRAQKVRDFLIKHGVKPDSIKIALQDEAVTFFGLLSSDQDDDRRVVVTHD
ncbi:OmpA family protein [Limibaculum sp. FT325]|uniref:OmpA family protein n=1 Tax=Thermohalobaculum sediminis TaxID=2939436 RepID=UPI0020C06081|nr:OmpA family protein [Limibaculum sediminis]MCL5776365.1 OmpA family protein [Limibaculum sediminis]